MKIRTNEDLVVDLMNYSPHGSMGQAFVIEAIRKYADAHATATDTARFVLLERDVERGGTRREGPLRCVLQP